MSTSTRPPRGPSRWIDGGGDAPARTYQPADPSRRLRLLALIVAFVLTIFRRTSGRPSVTQPHPGRAAVADRTAVVSLPAARGTIYDDKMNPWPSPSWPSM